MWHLAITLAILAVGAGAAAILITHRLAKQLEERYSRDFRNFVAVNYLYVLISLIYDYFRINVFEISRASHVAAASIMLLLPLLSVFYYLTFTLDFAGYKEKRKIQFIYLSLAIVLMLVSFHSLLASWRNWPGVDPAIIKDTIYGFYYLVMLACLVRLWLSGSNAFNPAGKSRAIRTIVKFYGPYFFLLALAKTAYVAGWVPSASYLGIYYLSNLVQALVIIFLLNRLILGWGIRNPDERMSVSLSDNIVAELAISNREQEVVQLICQGFSNKEIADELFISVATVKDHIHNVYQKTGVNNRVQLVNLLSDKGSRAQEILN